MTAKKPEKTFEKHRPFAALFTWAALGVFLVAVPSQSFAIDEKTAQKTFRKCASCHQIGKDSKNIIGPQLNGLGTRVIGRVEGYKYSKAMAALGEDESIWDTESLDAYLAKPRSYLKGTKMSFAGLKKASERENLVNWLLHFDLEGVLHEDDNQVGVNVLLGATAAAIEGDVEYGEYLSGECVTCHKLSGSTEGIPSIIGWPGENFIHALYEYKMKARENPVMQTVVGRLGDEEMAALAAYFGSLNSE